MKKYFSIIIAIIVAFVFASYAGNNIFLANTPRLNRNYLPNLIASFKRNIDKITLALSFPTIDKKNETNNTSFTANLQITPIITKIRQKPNFAQITPTKIPDNLFKYFSKGVSAYEGNGITVFRIEKGAKIKIRKIEVNGKQYEIIDLTRRE
jgi:hypothetical protein